MLQSWRDAAERKALAALDAKIEDEGDLPIVEVSLELVGREIAGVGALECVLDELRTKILQELAAKHRVRLR